MLLRISHALESDLAIGGLPPLRTLYHRVEGACAETPERAGAVIQLDEQRQVTECLDSLTDAQRECIQLAYYEGLTYVQVSDRLTANLATIKSRMRDAIRGLRNCLGVS